MQRPLIAALATAALTLVPFVSVAQSRPHRSFTLKADVFCRGMDGTVENSYVCGGSAPLTKATLRKRIIKAVAVANRAWQVNGISFVPEVIFHDSQTDPTLDIDTLALYKGFDVTTGAPFTGVEHDQLAALAASDPTSIHWIMNESHRGASWSGLGDYAVWTAIPVENIEGVGNNLAHELGHYFGLAHTFSFDDRPGLSDGDNGPLVALGGVGLHSRRSGDR